MGGVTDERALGELLRRSAPAALGVLVRRGGDFEAAEDAVQEALLAAAKAWPVEGVPTNPTGWLVTTAYRRLVEAWRSEAARRRRELGYALQEPSQAETPSDDDSLALLFMCCHPVLPPSSQVALTLRALGGLTTSEIAHALLVPAPTVAQRISRAKATIRQAGVRFAPPTPDEITQRLPSVLRVLYLVFNEGYTSSEGADLQRVELTAEAIRLTRQLRAALPEEGEVTGLLALMLLTDARRHARTGPDGELVPLAAQDRTRWDAAAIAEGVELITSCLATAVPGPYQLQAAIAAVHDEAPSAEATDWPQILALYEVLERLDPGPAVALNRIVATAMVRGPAEGLALLDAADTRLDATGHRRDAVRAHLLDELGDHAAAREYYLRAARGTSSLPERSYLISRAAHRPA